MKYKTNLTNLVLISILSLFLSCRVASNPDIGRFESASCPKELPDGFDYANRMEFGYVTVPEFHAEPAGRTIKIAVARIKSDNDNPRTDPIVLNTGGPGDSNMDMFLPLFSGPIGQALLAERDVVIIELRGLRYSKPNLICHEMFEAQLSMIDKDVSGDESNRLLLEAMQASYNRFHEEEINLSAFNNVETAADIDMIMTTLGYDKFNLFGSSAGTMIAQHVMRDFPNRLRAVVLNAAVPYGLDLFKNMMKSSSSSLERLFQMCEEDDSCRDAFPNMEEAFFAFMEQLKEEPVTIQVINPNNQERTPFVLNGDKLATWIFSTMYANTQIPFSLGKFMEGDYSQLEHTANIFFPMRNFSYGLSYSITLSEEREFQLEDIDIKGPYGAFVNGTSMFFSPNILINAQEFWEVNAVDASLLTSIKSDVPTLILNGELDHVIPEAEVEKLNTKLSNGYIYIFPGVAHSPIDAGSCAFSMTLEFLSNPTQAPASSCMEAFKHVFKTE